MVKTAVMMVQVSELRPSKMDTDTTYLQGGGRLLHGMWLDHDVEDKFILRAKYYSA